MKRYTFLQMAVAATLVLSLTTVLHADVGVFVSHSHSGSGFGIALGTRIGPRIGVPRCPPAYPWDARHVTIGPPVRHHPVRLGPPYVQPVVVTRPWVRPVVVEPAPTVIVTPPAPVTEVAISVWITNSNGSQTSVRLTRQGSWYIGPRGEYYSEMPTNEQLRIAYGF